MRVLILGIALWLATDAGWAQTLTASSYGDTREQARENVLADLASRISVFVEAENKLEVIETQDSYSDEFTQNILTRSELPLLGVDFSYFDTADGIRCTATMTAHTSRELYEAEIVRLSKEFNATFEGKTLSDFSLETLYELQNTLEQIEKLKVAGAYFDLVPVSEVVVTITVLKEAVRNRAESVSSMSDFAQIVQTRFGDMANNVYVYPPAYESNSEITSFAKTVRNQIAASLNSVDQPGQSRTMVHGSYREAGDQLELTLRLTGKDNSTISGLTLKFNPSLYQSYTWKPSTTNLDQLIKDGVVVSSELQIELSTNKGKTDLLFTEGETINLLVKTNQAVYVYFVGHNTSAQHKFSYLLPISNGNSKRDMIMYINADDVNKWISLGEFEIVPPFGVERLQAFASTEDLIDALPDFYWNEDGYPEIGKDPNAVVVSTRGLARKKKKEAETSEGILNFTTMEQ